ncbi:MAG TPA: hypothetical protein VFC78_11525 [Tepidisphaeraceae bacterium]|nr:hypothetical protein [Tepidisphaeraceae bacterium]
MTRKSVSPGGASVETLEGRVLLSASVGPSVPINLSRMPGAQAEGTIAVNPANPSEMFVVSNNNGMGLFATYSPDGGKTWQSRIMANGADGLPLACCDPSAAFDEFGNLFFVYLGENSNQAELLVSTDGGQSFAHVASLGVAADQPTVAAGHGEVWVAFQQSLQGQPPRAIALGGAAAKVDTKAGAVAYGAAVTGLGRVGPIKKPEAITGPPGTNVGDIAIGSAGQLMVAFQSPTNSGPSTIFVRVDPDGLGNKTFGPAIAVATTNVSDFYAIPAQVHRTIDAEVGLAFDNSGGPLAGRVYMVYTDAAAPGSADTFILLRHSDNDGRTWSAAVRVNDDSTANSKFFPRLAVDPASGAVGLTWYDARNDTGDPSTGGGTDARPNDEPQFWGAVGTPTAQGVAFSPNFPVTTAFSDTNITNDANDFGDYTGLAFNNGNLRPVWADNSNSTGDNPEKIHSGLDIYTSQILVTGVALPARTLLGEFGDLGGKFTFAAPNGARVTITLTHGSGYVFRDGASIDLVLRNTDARSSLLLTARGHARIPLGNIAISGSLRSIIAPTADLTGTISIAGSVAAVSLGNVMGGIVAAGNSIGTFSASTLTGAKLLAGASLGTDGQIGGGDDAYAPGTIGLIKLTGPATNSFIAAGFAPADGLFDNSAGTVLGGIASEIRAITIRGGVDASTRFIAGAFGAVRIPGRVQPGSDPRFTV